MRKTKLFVTMLGFVFGQTVLMAQTISPWQIHEGNEGVVSHHNASQRNGDPSAYDKARIPAENDGGWHDAPTDSEGNVSIDRPSTIECWEQLDFTYFQTTVNIPSNTNVNLFNVTYDHADDGARVYIFNSKFPNGTFDPAADLIIGDNRDNTGNIDLRSRIVTGSNRIVIVQFDDCADRNTVKGIHVKVNGKEIEHPSVELKAKKFQVNAYSINQGKDLGMWYFGYSNNDQKTGRIVKKGDANSTILSIEKITVDGYGPNVYAFKVVGTSNNYLAVEKGGGERVFIESYPGSTPPVEALFRNHPALTKATGAEQFSTFESIAKPDYFLRHTGLVLYVHKETPSELYKQDASWKIEEVTQNSPRAAVASGKRLISGQRIDSENGTYYLKMQIDGNLVVYRTADDGYIWSYTGDGNALTQGAYCEMGEDGNLGIYFNDNSGNRVWKWSVFNTASQLTSGSYLQLTNEGKIQIIAPNGTVKWSKP